MYLKSQIPNLLTLSNLLSGVLSLFFCSQNQPEIAAWLILAGAGFDFFDGLAARALGVSGELGKQLDSLADMVSFGVAPVFLALQFNGVFGKELLLNWKALALFIPILMGAFSAYRLGKFNIDTRQATGFIGLPTPANALFWVSIALVGTGGLIELEPLNSGLTNFKESTGLIAFASVLLGILMVSEIPLLALKFSGESGGNKSKIALIAIGLTLFILFGFSSIPIVLLLYFILSLITK
ncbi:CDP-diacylglycerol--serine O-phosphatidyltransferase [Cryomorphaceae bacterium 1068]|nr:CDP-diacylglycerol--serine O-phosphatidyltransferase [Cryomorphaceae bacterium 1068]